MNKRDLRNIICGLVVLVVISLVSYFRIFEIFELQTLDLRFKLRGVSPQAPEIVIIEIADDSLEKIGRWPFDRIWHARLIEALANLGVRQIGFDIIFTEESPSDSDLIASTREAGNVYFPLAFPISPPLLPRLQRVAKGAGHININPDIDGKRRKVPLFVEYQGKFYPQMALMMAADYLGTGLEHIEIPVDEQGEMLINYAGRWAGTFRHYSYVDVLTSYAQMSKGQEPTIPVRELKGKICFIGLTATGAHDLNPVPLEARFPMVGVQANIFNSIVQGDFLTRAARVTNIIVLVVVTLLVGLMARKMRPWVGALSTSSVMIFYSLTSYSLFKYFGCWIDTALPLVVIFGGYLGFVFSRYLQARKAREIMEHELEIARKIQSRFLPQAYPEVSGIEIAARMIPAHQIGGDFYDFTKIDQQKVGVVIGDVSGKGVPAALYMAMIISVFRSETKLSQEVNRVLEKVNANLAEKAPGGTFASALYLVLDAREGKVKFSNAGHLPLMLVKSQAEEGNSTQGKVNSEDKGGIPLGINLNTTYEEAELEFKKGDILVLYTDGLVESQNARGEFFGEGRLKEVVKAKSFLGTEYIVDDIIDEVERFSKGLPRFDDLTVVVIKKSRE